LQDEQLAGWWHDTNLWRERYSISSIRRPVEDAAFDNVYAQSREARGGLSRNLNGLERKVYRFELQSFNECPRYFNETERLQWVANKTGMTIHMVKDILNEVSWVLRDLDTAEILKATRANILWRDLVKEAMLESA
jgi:hypothetical protein